MIEFFLYPVAVLLISLTIRTLYYVLNIDRKDLNPGERVSSLKTLICLGSGGHTAEMLRILKGMDLNSYSPRLYVMASNDNTSEAKVERFEDGKNYSVVKIFRSREVGQSYISSVLTTLIATVNSFPLVVSYKPRVLVCNGPGTCIPVCFVAFLMNLLFLLDCKIVFVESICRVRSLSLTGQLLKYVANVFVVQWEPLLAESGRFKYFGRLS